ncbi:hypothetical protein DOTSEDRAFT_73420 [Dothistroma septosporum NZE10]|uniref:Uncharacterized protein n=1 Tax=Dothistroma septosporum (strain NZE10 / CBS 128990) TaxID=675120 RepID=N1PKD4_DOTSN|nr:hypothetical protein DOTSEDRAFT_73420 [Dothistroma septosporum NZE10]
MLVLPRVLFQTGGTPRKHGSDVTPLFSGVPGTQDSGDSELRPTFKACCCNTAGRVRLRCTTPKEHVKSLDASANHRRHP